MGGIYSSGQYGTGKRFSFMSNLLSNQRDNFHVKSEEQGKRELCQLAEFAINFRFTILRFNKENGTNFNVQIGLAYGGQVVAGVVGKDTPQYDILGPTVNLASRMMTTGKLDKIQLPKHVGDILKKHSFTLDDRPELV